MINYGNERTMRRKRPREEEEPPKKRYKTTKYLTTKSIIEALVEDTKRLETSMAKEVATTATKEVVANPGISDELASALLNDAGGGLSRDRDDSIVPLAYVAQPLSPTVIRAKPEYIPGAEAGDILLRNFEPPFIKGDKGIIFQPCYFYKNIVEWMPDRSGFAGTHDIECLPNVASKKPWTGTLKDDVKEVFDQEDPNGRPEYVRNSNGNTLVETRYFVGYIYFEDGVTQPMPFVLPLSSTGHSFGKQFMFLQNAQINPITKMPNDKSWLYKYRLTTTMKTNKKGSWYMYSAKKEGLIDLSTAEEYNRGKELNALFASGEKVADYASMQNEGGGGDSEPLNNDEM